MIPFEEALGTLLRQLGLPEPGVMTSIIEEWPRLAGEPWVSKAIPSYLRSGVLVVEATQPGAVSFLRYGVGELERRLSERFGARVVSSVEIRPPSHRGRPA